MTALAIGATVTGSVGYGGEVILSTSGGFSSYSVIPVAGVARTFLDGPFALRRVHGPYSEGATWSLTNQSCANLDYVVFAGPTGGAFNGATTITATGAVSGSIATTPGKTVSFTWTNASGITRCGVRLLSGTTPIGYVDYPDGDNQLFVIPAGVTQMTYSCDLLDGSGSITLNLASI